MRTLFNCAIGIAALSTLALAQGKYETLGSGCGAMSSASIQVNNKTATTANVSPALFPNDYSYPVNVSATTITVIAGARFFTKSSGGYKSVEARIYIPSSTSAMTPSSTPLDTTRMTVGRSSDYWMANFNKPHVIKGPFWLSYDAFATTRLRPERLALMAPLWSMPPTSGQGRMFPWSTGVVRGLRGLTHGR